MNFIFQAHLTKFEEIYDIHKLGYGIIFKRVYNKDMLSNKSLTKKQKELLLKTPEDAFKFYFPKHQRDFLRREKRNLINKLPIEKKIEKDFEYRDARKEAQESRQKLNYLIGENEKLEKLLEAQTTLKHNLQTFEIKPKKDNNDSEATAVVLLSDWHIDEVVAESSINALNKFDYEIAEQRATETFRVINRLLDIFQRDIHIYNLVLWLGGDFISGSIHEDLQENNSMLPIDAIWKVQNLLVSGIKFLLENSDVNLIIPCSCGNHSRITEKQRVSTEQGNSLETLLYKNLAMYFEDEPRVKFIISDSYHTYLDIYSYTLRFHHGHSIQYGGGIGGLFIPAYKAISQWNKGKNAYLDCFGHFHQKKDGGNFVSNGSLIGFNQYAIKIKADFDKPSQTFFLVDKKRGKTILAPIIL